MKTMRFLFCFAAILATSITSPAQTYSVVKQFSNANVAPSGPLTQGRDGYFYGVSGSGGTHAEGAVFKMSTTGAMTILHSFSSTDGKDPAGALTLGSDGNFYGTTVSGGSGKHGTVFKITPGGSLTVLHEFGGAGSGGYCPVAPPVEGTDGNFYGTTSGCNTGGYGTVYKITPSGVFTLLYTFDYVHGSGPRTLILGVDGNFYGTTAAGGLIGAGVAYKITPSGVRTRLYSFSHQPGPLIQGKDGYLYGTTNAGGDTTCNPPYGCGMIFKMSTAGVLTVLHNMGPVGDGVYPSLGLQGSDGNIYGLSGGGILSDPCEGLCGSIFEITPGGSYSVLYSFEGASGSEPLALMQHTNGKFYGTTLSGGSGFGVFFRLNAHLPEFFSLLPYSGFVGDSIGFLGQGFSGATSVSFGGIDAAFNIVSDTYLAATVPSSAKTGLVHVKEASGTLNSSKQFQVRTSQ
jgi:uncharacterized repeat protein (TIGR03803 family)